MKLRGNGIPLSPSGKASYRMETYRYVGRVLYILFQPRVEVLEGFIPPPLCLVSDTALVKIYELKRRRLHADFVEPEYSHYNEAVIAAIARYGEEIGHYNFYMWVNRDWAMWKGREVLGFPKKLAEVAITKEFEDEAQFDADRPVRTLLCTAARYGHRILEAAARLMEPGSLAALPHLHALYTLRVIPSPSEDGPVLRELIRLQVEQVQIGQVWTGDATLRFFDGPDEELEVLQPTKVLGAYYFPISWNLPAYPGKVIHRYDAPIGEEGF